MIAVTESVPVLAEHLGPVAGVRAAADAARQLVKIHRLAVRKNIWSRRLLFTFVPHLLSPDDGGEVEPPALHHRELCVLQPQRGHLRPRPVPRPHVDQGAVPANMLIRQPTCQQSVLLSPPDGHLHVVLDDDEHLVVSPAPGAPPRRHDAAVPPRRHHTLLPVAELEIPDHVFVKIFSKYNCKICRYRNRELSTFKVLHLPSLVDVLLKK